MNRPSGARAALLCCLLTSCGAASAQSPFDHFDLPDAWEAKFWLEKNTALLRKMEPKAVADLVPVQGGFHSCRCPKCGATEAEDTLTWSLEKPDLLTCRKCGKTVPDADIPAKVDGKIPQESIEVLPRRFHHYPYHAVEAEKQLYPDERIYLQAKRDYQVREFLAKFALYAAVRHREANDPALARLSCTILLHFAQVYPAYATHYDQPGRPKFLDRADLPPPYRREYGTAKWDWSGCLDVPLDLVLAHAILRDDPAMAESGRLLNEPNPRRTIERNLFHASAEFVRNQPAENSVFALYSIRGMLAVGRLLDDPAFIHEGMKRLNGFLDRGFYHDGVWRHGDGLPQRRVLGQIDGWIDRLLAGYSDPPGFVTIDATKRLQKLAGVGELPMIVLARSAEGSVSTAPRLPDVLLASWPAPVSKSPARRPALLGGAGIARLGVGAGDDALDLDLRGMGDFGNIPSGRLALRVAVGGRTMLGDGEDSASSPWGFDLSTASHNTVLVDGLNQREDIGNLRESAPGSDVLFFAADPDFQAVMMGDRYAYPHSTKIYRQIVIACASEKSRYAVSIFEVRGGLQHDQIYHAASGNPGRWRLSVPTTPGPNSLLPPTITFLPNARAEDGRWFVQSMGAFSDLKQARLDQPLQAELSGKERPTVRLHVFPVDPAAIFLGTTPDPSTDGRGALILHRRSMDGAGLDSTFIAVIEPVGPSPPLRRVGKVASSADAVVLDVETAEGPEYLVVNLKASSTIEAALPGGRVVKTDGLAVRVTARGPVLAGGTFADVGPRHLQQSRVSGKIVGSGRSDRRDALGYFLTEKPLSDASTLVGRILLIRHGDGTTRGWTIAAVGPTSSEHGGSKITVRERNGFSINSATGVATYDQFPGLSAPGPHEFGISKMVR